MRLSRRRLNRTLLARQHLLERLDASPAVEIGHLVGLQAQDNLPPYLSLAARLETLDPHAVTRGLENRSLVRLLTMRGTVHLLRAEDAVVLRPWTQPRMEAELRQSQSVGPAARALDRGEFDTALRTALADGPLPLPELSGRLAERFEAVPAAALGNLARVAAPLAQLPPRGGWRRSGGVVYDLVDRWTRQALVEPDDDLVQGVVRRYLTAFGPARAADVTAWSGVTRLAPVLAAMDDLERHDDEAGRPLYDVPGATIADEDAPAPVRLLGVYDNLWLSHAERDRVSEPECRRRWMGANGGAGCALLAGGWLEGLWRVVDGRVEILDTFRTLTRLERSELDDEVARVEALLAVPAGGTDRPA